MVDNMKDLREIARQVCEEMGIEWNENSTEATINGRPMTSEDLWRAFDLILGYKDK